MNDNIWIAGVKWTCTDSNGSSFDDIEEIEVRASSRDEARAEVVRLLTSGVDYEPGGKIICLDRLATYV